MFTDRLHPYLIGGVAGRGVYRGGLSGGGPDLTNGAECTVPASGRDGRVFSVPCPVLLFSLPCYGKREPPETATDLPSVLSLCSLSGILKRAEGALTSVLSLLNHLYNCNQSIWALIPLLMARYLCFFL